MKRQRLWNVLIVLLLPSVFMYWVTDAKAQICTTTVGEPGIPTIQAAIDSGCPLVIIPAGTYNERVSVTINSDRTISGAGSAGTIVDAGLALNERGFSVVLENNAVVTLSGVTIQNADATGLVVTESDGRDSNMLRLVDVVIRNNRASGIVSLNKVHLSLHNSQVINNSGDGSLGAGISAQGWLTLTNSSVLSNTMFGSTIGIGGGIFMRSKHGEKLYIADSTVAHNRVLNGVGGGLAVYDGAALIERSLIAQNQGDMEGGGIFVLSREPMKVSNVTLANNSADKGSAIITAVSNSNMTRTLNLEFVTLAGNRSQRSAVTASTIFAENSMVTLAHTLFYNNENFDCESDNAQFQSQGFNIEPSNDCFLYANGDRQNTTSVLLPLAGNGGPTLTMMPQLGSPAIEGGSFLCLGSDQRGFARPFDADPFTLQVYCDIGAVEWRPAASPTAVAFASHDTLLRTSSWLLGLAVLLLITTAVRIRNPTASPS